ncbi:MEDS domain-containing protein [Pseudonocardia humida]|uniref:MEDS domain-containing protein n=1 Tax=Pseudonocardia humida TaxID=2800819 RepID=A0ABT1A229_9PSEU|nr:MEDS domain-containing protein [Pseudonocardia humida]MCO1656988.1 MEDS domain-containing protein [Pseudonocardia humida]
MTRTVEDLDHVTHTCLVPDSDDHVWEVTAAWLAGGLGAGERVMYFEDQTADALLGRLTDDRVPVDRALADGQFVLVPTEQTRATVSAPLDLFERMIDEMIRDTEAAGWPGLRLAGENVNVQLGMGVDAVVAYETVVDRLLREHPIARLLCRFDPLVFDTAAMAAVREVHTSELVTRSLYDDGLLRVTRTGPVALRLAGEADHSNRTVIRRFLDATLDQALRSEAAHNDITLDLSSLRFVDVSGAVGLVHTAEEFPDSHRLVLTGVRPRVARALERCGAPAARQLTIEPRWTEPVAPGGRG